MSTLWRFFAVLCLALLAHPFDAAGAGAWYPFPVEVWNPPFDMASPRTSRRYVPLARAERKWRVCVSIPHLKDAYWLAVNYGLADEARRLGVRMDLAEAGGYGNLDAQKSQIRRCAGGRPDGFIISAISFDGLNGVISGLRARGIPVVDLVNGVSSKEISAKSMVSFRDMGWEAGRFIVRRHRKGGEKFRVAWFPGPRGAGWVKAGDAGFREALKSSGLAIVASRYGDTGRSAQGKLINQVLDRYKDIAYLAGTAVTAEAAVKILRRRGLARKTGIVSYYFSPGVYRGIKRGTILAAPTDLPAIQGRIAMDQIVRVLEGKPYLKHVGPKIRVIDRSNLNAFDLTTSLAPRGFRATFKVN